MIGLQTRSAWQTQPHLGISICVFGMLVESHHEITKLAVSKGTVVIHACSLQTLGVDLAESHLDIIQQHLDG